MREYHELPGLERYGRRGQRQYGIDLIDLQSPPPLLAIQCKAEGLDEVYPVSDLEKEVAKALTAPFELKLFQILTTSKISTKLQKAISKINEAHRKSGKFLVEFKGWEQIERLLDDFSEVAQDKLTIITNAQVAKLNEGVLEIAAQLSNIQNIIANNNFDAEISAAKDEILRREFAIAKSRLSQLQNSKWDKLTEEQRFLVVANLGHIEASQNLAKQGADLLFQSLPYAKGTLKNREVEAQAYALRQNYEKTFELAQALKSDHPESWKATMLSIHSAPPTEKFEDLLARATEQDLTHQEVLVTLALRALNSGRYQIAREYAEKAMAVSDTPWPITKMTLAQSISHGVIFGNGSRPVEGLTEADKSLLGEADDLFKEAVDGAKARNEGYIAAPALVERAGLAERHGNEIAARGFVEEAFHLAPDEPSTRSAYALLLQRLGDKDRAVAMVEKLVADGAGGSWYKKQLVSLLLDRKHAGDEQRAATLLCELCLTTDLLAPHFRYITFAEALGLLDKTGRISEGQALINAATPTMVGPVARLALTARLLWLMKDNASARSYLEQAKSKLDDNSIDTELEIIAVTFGAIGDYREALALWRRLSGVHNPLATYQSLGCARQLGEHGIVLDICQEMRDAGVEDEESVQIEADLLAQDDFEGAIAVLKSFLEKNPDNAVIRLRISHMAIQRNRTDLLQRPSDALPDIETIPPYFARAVTYFLKCTQRTDEALRYGYEVLHRYFNDVDAHRAYMLLFVPLGPPIEFTNPEVVVPGSAVEYLECGQDHPRWHVIEDVLTPELKLNEYPGNHPLSQALLDKRIGDTIALSPGRISERPATITQIVSKYVYRYQCCMNALQTDFPDALELQAMHLPKLPDGQLDATEFLTALERQFAAKRQAIQAYSLQPLPLHFVAEVLGESSFEAILHLANDPKSIVRCAPDGYQQRLEAAISLAAATEVVLDLSAIATLFLCDAIDLVFKLNLPVIISQGCADEIDRITGKTNDGSPRAGLRFGWYEDRVVGVEVSEEQQAERDANFAEKLDKIRSIAVVEPCRELSRMPEDLKRPLIAIFGRYGAQAVLLAKKPGRVLWSDDFVQSSVVIKDHGGKPIWTELVVAQLEAKRLLTRHETLALISDLLNYRYESVTITPAIFVDSARRACLDPSVSPFNHVLTPFAQIRINQNFFGIIAGIAMESVREIPDARERALLIRAFLSSLIVRRDRIRLLSLIWGVFQGISPRWREEWIPIIEEVLTDVAIVVTDVVNRRWGWS